MGRPYLITNSVDMRVWICNETYTETARTCTRLPFTRGWDTHLLKWAKELQPEDPHVTQNLLTSYASGNGRSFIRHQA